MDRLWHRYYKIVEILGLTQNSIIKCFETVVNNHWKCLTTTDSIGFHSRRGETTVFEAKTLIFRLLLIWILVLNLFLLINILFNLKTIDFYVWNDIK